jgi:hypothetical protein
MTDVEDYFWVVVWEKFTDVSEVLTAPIIRAMIALIWRK